MVVQEMDGVCFGLRSARDLSFLSRYGSVFCAFDQNDSGNISFGLECVGRKLFVKVAGAETVHMGISPAQAVDHLKAAVPLYRVLRHPRLIRLVEAFPMEDLYVAAFEWAEGECLFDHWNFERYQRENRMSPPERYKLLPANKKLRSLSGLFDFLTCVEERGYVAVDFYDGSILYDFQADKTTVCDIDLFRKKPAFNDRGAEFWGSKRMKAPEEYQFGASLDSRTNVYTLGALMFHMLGEYTDEQIRQMYAKNRFFPCGQGRWQASEALYHIARKAVSLDRKDRFQSMAEFQRAWRQVLGW